MNKVLFSVLLLFFSAGVVRSQDPLKPAEELTAQEEYAIQKSKQEREDRASKVQELRAQLRELQQQVVSKPPLQAEPDIKTAVPAAAQQPQQQQTIPTLKMSKHVQWEYKLLDGNPSEQELNTLGSDSWELAGMAHKELSTIYVFKRAKHND